MVDSGAPIVRLKRVLELNQGGNSMKIIMSVFVLGLFGIVGCQKGGNVDLKSDKQKLSYAIGQQIGRQVKGSGLEIDSDVLAASIGDVVAGKESSLKPEEIQEAMRKT